MRRECFQYEMVRGWHSPIWFCGVVNSIATVLQGQARHQRRSCFREWCQPRWSRHPVVGHDRPGGMCLFRSLALSVYHDIEAFMGFHIEALALGTPAYSLDPLSFLTDYPLVVSWYPDRYFSAIPQSLQFYPSQHPDTTIRKDTRERGE